MTPYKNNGGDSGIVAYGMESDSITVEFKAGRHRFYLYTNQSAGSSNIEQMKALATEGEGLNSFIKRHANTRYARRW